MPYLSPAVLQAQVVLRLLLSALNVDQKWYVDQENMEVSMDAVGIHTAREPGSTSENKRGIQTCLISFRRVTFLISLSP